MSLPELKVHQREGIDWIQTVRRGLLADEPGLGKTRQAIEAFDGGRNLVVAPKLVIEGGTWDDEIRKWSATPENWTVVPYTQLNARKYTGKHVSATRPVNALRPEFRGKRNFWDAVIMDEVHYVKGRDSVYSKVAIQLARNCHDFLAMTGTPFPNWSHEIYNILRMIEPEEGKQGMGGKYSSYWDWAENWFDCSPTKWSKGFPVAGEMLGCAASPKQLKECLSRPASDPCEHYLEFARVNLDGKYLRRWREDCLDLPPITDTDVLSPMDAKTKRVYAGLKNDFYARYEGQEVVAWTSGSQHVQMHKLTTSPWLLNPVGEPRGGKLDLLRFDLQSRTRPTLVFAHYKDSVEACALVASSLGASVGIVHGGIPERQRVDAFTSFKSGNLDVLVGSLETLSEGHTLVAADMALFVEESFKPYRNEQAKNRVYRMGQERPVTIRRYLCPHSLDSRKRRLLMMKTDRQMRTLTAAEMMEIL